MAKEAEVKEIIVPIDTESEAMSELVHYFGSLPEVQIRTDRNFDTFRLKLKESSEADTPEVVLDQVELVKVLRSRLASFGIQFEDKDGKVRIVPLVQMDITSGHWSTGSNGEFYSQTSLYYYRSHFGVATKLVKLIA
uniref:Uncharacterized protein n=1 Tax=viral metagenome TaxID=1070528 RepID=A0A6M3LFK7_9ZZZZ